MINLDERIVFHQNFQIMEVDFSHIDFSSSDEVNTIYDEIDGKIKATGQKWYFLVNYERCQIDQTAWVAFGYRGKILNLAWSLGTVRFSAQKHMADAIEEKAKLESFDSNLFRSRKAAVAELMIMQRDAEAAATAA